MILFDYNDLILFGEKKPTVREVADVKIIVHTEFLFDFFCQDTCNI